MSQTEHKAVVLLSGGMDSATAAALARDGGFSLYALTIRYGQRHDVETQAALRVGRMLGVCEHRVLTLDLRAWGGSALTDAVAVPKGRSPQQMDADIPVTYVPARNTIFLALALGYAEAIGAGDIFIGVSAVDYSGYPDCRPEFIAAFAQVARLGTRAGVAGNAIRIHAPLLHLSKASTIQEGVRLGLNYGLTHSCYDPDPAGRACGACDSCILRRRGFADAGVPDPTVYAS
ncbi:MAG TPA: 7-cyano-7-deazaguanine synthase QueC [Phycisphaerae bacterium]|nr:7-cyano-7-deazaguanine synthase QueC [Phycisphaerae bacterium]HNU45327.1 7-cyano-7-deazaguanine synthase QueC [Phycisphaerae bacterium]